MELKEIKQLLTINQVLEHYHLKPDKNNRLLCPFHNDKTPSLQIYPATNTYCCFSSNCNAGTGDAIQFIELMEKCNKHEALIKATSLINGGSITGGSKVPPSESLPRLVGGFREADSIDKIAVLTKFFTYYKTGLARSKKAVDYLQSRCIDYKIIEAAFNSGGLHAESKHHHLIESMVKVGLLKPLTGKWLQCLGKRLYHLPLKEPGE